jgi:hypothetical protein
MHFERSSTMGVHSLDIINEYAPKFMHYKALEMIQEGDFDDDKAVRGHFKRITWKEMMTEGEAEEERKQFQSFHNPTVPNR